MTKCLNAQGLTTVVALEAHAKESEAEDAAANNETWVSYPDDSPRRSPFFAGDSRAAMVPLLAHEVRPYSNCNISLHLLVCGSPYEKGPQVFGWFFSLCCHPSSLIKARHVSGRHHFGKWHVFSHAICLYASSGHSTKNFFRLQGKTWSAKPGKIS